jgi:hypothetical protein
LPRTTDRVRRDVLGDYDRRRVLVRIAESAAVTDAVRAQVASASRAVRSDYEQRHVLTSVMTDPMSRPVAEAILAAAVDLGGDHDRSTVLVSVAQRGGLQTSTTEPYLALVRGLRGSYDQRRVLTAVAGHQQRFEEPVVVGAIAAADSIQSDYEQRVALTALMGTRTTPVVAAMLLKSMNGLTSGYERAQVLKALVERGGLTDGTASAFFQRLAGLSSYEQRRVLETVIQAPTVAETVLLGVLRQAALLGNDHDRATLLLAIAATRPLSPAARERYIETAGTIGGEYEQSRVLAALVRAERK